MEQIYEEIKEALSGAERILIGIGAEWKSGDEGREAMVVRAAETLRNLVDGTNYFVISTMNQEDLDRLGFEKEHTVAPLDVSLTEEQWNVYTAWLSRTLNRKLVILELGEGFKHPSVIRWPFERTAAINNKAHLYRVHRLFYQIPEEIGGKATAVKGDSVALFADGN